MAFEEPSASNTSKQEKAESRSNSSDFDIKAFLRYLWRKKFWILLSVLAFGIYGYCRYKKEPHSYRSEARVMFLFGNETTSAGARIVGLENLAGNMNVNMNNEMEMIKSPALMEDVVSKLGLEVQYATPRMGYWENLYGYSPVSVFFPEVGADSAASFVMRRLDDKTVLAYDFVNNGWAVDGPGLRIPLNSVVESPVGQIAIIATGNYHNFPPEVRVSKMPIQRVASSLSSRVSTTFESMGNTVVTIGFVDSNQQLATDIVSALIVSYNELCSEESRRSATQTSSFIRERLVSLESELSGIDRNIASKKKAVGSSDFSDAYSGRGEERFDAAYDINTSLAIAENVRSRVMAALNTGEPIVATTGNSGVDRLIGQYNELLAESKVKTDGAGENNPVLQQYNSQLEQMRSGIASGLNSMIADYRLQSSRVQSLGSVYKDRGNAIPDVEADILPVERQQKVKESLYLYLLQKREENELNKLISRANTRVIQPAHAVGVAGPYMMQSMSPSLIVGLALPLVVLFLIFRLDTRVKSRADLEGLAVPLLGEIPMSGKVRKNRGGCLASLLKKGREEDDANIDIVVKERSRNYINEAFRMLRTSLGFMISSNDGSQVILVTSNEPASGKTFITLNLAVSLALRDKKVLVIDTDLRRASISKYQGNTAQGLSACLAGKVADPMALVVRDRKLGIVDVLNVGNIPPNPVELLLSDNFRKLIAESRRRYDYILLDCPPYELVADTSIIAAEADASIFVIRAGLFMRNAIADVETLYESGKLPHMAILLNGVEPLSTYYNHRFGYKSDHGYYKEDAEDGDDSESGFDCGGDKNYPLT